MIEKEYLLKEKKMLDEEKEFLFKSKKSLIEENVKLKKKKDWNIEAYDWKVHNWFIKTSINFE